jgi:hypothetical protein
VSFSSCCTLKKSLGGEKRPYSQYRTNVLTSSSPLGGDWALGQLSGPGVKGSGYGK